MDNVERWERLAAGLAELADIQEKYRRGDTDAGAWDDLVAKLLGYARALRPATAESSRVRTFLRTAGLGVHSTAELEDFAGLAAEQATQAGRETAGPFTVGALAEMFNVTPRTVRNWASTGRHGIARHDDGYWLPRSELPGE